MCNQSTRKRNRLLINWVVFNICSQLSASSPYHINNWLNWTQFINRACGLIYKIYIRAQLMKFIARRGSGNLGFTCPVHSYSRKTVSFYVCCYIAHFLTTVFQSIHFRKSHNVIIDCKCSSEVLLFQILLDVLYF